VSAVELRLGKIRARLEQDLIGLSKLPVLPLGLSLAAVSPVRPGLCPLSRAAFFTHSFSVCDVQTILPAIETIAASFSHTPRRAHRTKRLWIVVWGAVPRRTVDHGSRSSARAGGPLMTAGHPPDPCRARRSVAAAQFGGTDRQSARTSSVASSLLLDRKESVADSNLNFFGF
jgi:hypothetical protein